jgi:hypothetical protein
MQPLGHEIEDGTAAIGGGTARLLHHHRQRRRFVHESQLALRRARIRRIEEHAAGDQIAVQVRHEGSDVSSSLRLHLSFAIPEGSHGVLYSRGPAIAVTLVDAVVLAHGRRPHAGM